MIQVICSIILHKILGIENRRKYFRCFVLQYKQIHRSAERGLLDRKCEDVVAGAISETRRVNFTRLGSRFCANSTPLWWP